MLNLLSITLFLLLACMLCTVFALLFIFMHQIKRINDVMQHPYLHTIPWHRLTLGNKTGILLDYFFRLFFPNAKKGIRGNANQLLAHVNPSEVPTSVKLPILALWGGCFLGILLMIILWVLILFIYNNN